MAELDIAEFKDFGGPYPTGAPRWFSAAPVAQVPPLTGQILSIGAVSTPSATFNTLTNVIRVKTDTACRIEIGENPTASATSYITLAANQTEYFGLSQKGLKLAVITY